MSSNEERVGKRIARKVMREMLNSSEHRQDIDAVAERYVVTAKQAAFARKHVRIYCRQLVAALRELP